MLYSVTVETIAQQPFIVEAEDEDEAAELALALAEEESLDHAIILDSEVINVDEIGAEE